MNVHINNNAISNIASHIEKDKSEEDYVAIYKIDKNTENGYYLVKWTVGRSLLM